MTAMAKELCKLKKGLKSEPDSYMLLVNQPTHICQKCGRAANSKKRLCEPLPIVNRS
jgi:hypothetical protein